MSFYHPYVNRYSLFNARRYTFIYCGKYLYVIKLYISNGKIYQKNEKVSCVNIVTVVGNQVMFAIKG